MAAKTLEQANTPRPSVFDPSVRDTEEKASQVIDQVPRQHPFEMKYGRIADVDWESCAEVLDSQTQLDALMRSWT